MSKEPMNQQKITQKIVDCEEFDELYDVLNELENIVGSREIVYSASEMIERIERIRSGEELTLATRSHGIRAKVAELLYYED